MTPEQQNEIKILAEKFCKRPCRMLVEGDVVCEGDVHATRFLGRMYTACDGHPVTSLAVGFYYRPLDEEETTIITEQDMGNETKPLPHAEEKRQYAEDWIETSTPWVRWEFRWKSEDPNKRYSRLTGHPGWHPNAEYRRIQKTVTINGFEMPCPVREPLEVGEEYWIFDPSCPDNVVEWAWGGAAYENRLLRAGMIHRTREAAMKHAEAIMSFTKLPEQP